MIYKNVIRQCLRMLIFHEPLLPLGSLYSSRVRDALHFALLPHSLSPRPRAYSFLQEASIFILHNAFVIAARTLFVPIL